MNVQMGVDISIRNRTVVAEGEKESCTNLDNEGQCFVDPTNDLWIHIKMFV